MKFFYTLIALIFLLIKSECQVLSEWSDLNQKIEDHITANEYQSAHDLALQNLRKVKKLNNDTLLSKLYLALGIGFYRPNPSEGIVYLDSALAISINSINRRFILRLMNAKALFQKKLGLLQQAKETSMIAYKIARRSAPDMIFLSTRSLSINCRELGQYDSALYYILIADSMAKVNNNEQEKFLALQGMSNIYLETQQFDEAIGLTDELLSLGKSSADSMFNLQNLGLAWLGVEKFDNALNAFTKSLLIAEQRGDSIEMANIHNLIGETLVTMEMPLKAIKHLKKALAIVDKSDPATELSYSHDLLTKAYFMTKDYSMAEMHNRKTIELAKAMGNEELMMRSLEMAAEIAYQKGDGLKSYQLLQSYIEAYRKYNGAERIELVEELQTKYETRQKEQEIAGLTQENYIKDLQIREQNIFLLFGVIMFLLVIGIGFGLNRQSRLRSLKKRLELEQSLLRSQMNPHFIFNALSSIQGFITKNDRQQAATYLAKFGELTRDILEASRGEKITLAKELQMARNYVDLEQARFGKPIHLEITHPDIIPDDILIPPMLIQPFLENAIKHGLKNQNSGIIEVQLHSDTKYLHLTIIDNGMGLEKNSFEKEGSLALKITRERLLQIHTKQPKDYFKISNKKDENGHILGAQVNLVLPLNYAI